MLVHGSLLSCQIQTCGDVGATGTDAPHVTDNAPTIGECTSRTAHPPGSPPRRGGSAIHVMLVKRFRATVGQKRFQYGGGQQQAMVIREVCLQCGSLKYKRNGMALS